MANLLLAYAFYYCNNGGLLCDEWLFMFFSNFSFLLKILYKNKLNIMLVRISVNLYQICDIMTIITNTRKKYKYRYRYKSRSNTIKIK